MKNSRNKHNSSNKPNKYKPASKYKPATPPPLDIIISRKEAPDKLTYTNKLEASISPLCKDNLSSILRCIYTLQAAIKSGNYGGTNPDILMEEFIILVDELVKQSFDLGLKNSNNQKSDKVLK